MIILSEVMESLCENGLQGQQELYGNDENVVHNG
jgi:hypothetical protein